MTQDSPYNLIEYSGGDRYTMTDELSGYSYGIDELPPAVSFPLIRCNRIPEKDRKMINGCKAYIVAFFIDARGSIVYRENLTG